MKTLAATLIVFLAACAVVPVDDPVAATIADVALLSGRPRMPGRCDAKPFTTLYRYIDVYVKRDGRWKIVSVQISKIPAA